MLEIVDCELVLKETIYFSFYYSKRYLISQIRVKRNIKAAFIAFVVNVMQNAIPLIFHSSKLYSSRSYS